MAEKLEVIVTATDQASGILSKIGGLGKGLLGAGLGVVAAGAAAAGAAVVGMGAGLTYSLGEAMAAQETMAQLDAVIKSTGGAAGWTADMATGLADQLSTMTRYEDDAIIAGESMLLTFTNIGSNVFPGATQAMLDMSTAMGQDLQTSAVQIGKALNDPIAGIGALSRVGIQFTDDQKAMIEGMVESGNVMGAQTIILQELQKEFGGSAEAAGNTFGGQLDRLKNTLGNVAESVGGALLPSLQILGDKFLSFVQSDEFQAWVEKLADWLANKLPPAIEAFTAFITDKVIPALTDVWKWIDTNVVPVLKMLWEWLGTNLPPALERLSQFWNGVLLPALRAVWEFLKTNVFPIFNELKTFFTITIPQAISVLRGKWDENFLGIKTRVETTFANIRDIFNIFKAIFEGDWRRVGELIRDIWDRTWEAAKETFRRTVDAAVELARSLGQRIREIDWLQLGKDIILGIGNGMIAMTEWVQGALLSILQAAVAMAKGFLGIQSPSKVMADQIGKQMAAGIGVGLQSGLSGLSANVTTGLGMLAPATANVLPMSRNGGSVVVNVNAGTVLSFADEIDLEQKLSPIVRRVVRKV